MTQSSARACQRCTYADEPCFFGRYLRISHTEQGKSRGLDLQILKLSTEGARSEDMAAHQRVGRCKGAGASCRQAVGNTAVYKVHLANRRD